MTPENFTPDYDGTWKEVLRSFLYDMIKSVLPRLYAELNTDEQPIFLDNELESLAHELSSLGGNIVREVDLLADLPLKNKHERENIRILLHCEVQGRGGKEDLNLRMYRYKSLLGLRYKKNIVALAIITEPLPAAQMSGEYREEDFGTELIYRFNVLKVFEASEKLRESDNPFDMAQLAAARAWRAKNDELTRLEYLKEFIKLLTQKGWCHEEKFKILKFLETMAKIRKPEYKQNYLDFVVETKQKEEKEPMLTMIEERGIEIGEARGIAKGEARGIAKGKVEGEARGIAKGMLEGKLQTARKLLAMGLSLDLISQATGLDEAQLRA